MNFKDAVTSAFKNYANFKGRAARSEYWYFILFSVLLGIFIGACGEIFLPPKEAELLASIIQLALFLPTLSVSVRRLHDLDKSGWWVLVLIIPIIGTIVFIVWACKKGTDGNNQYGPDPIIFTSPTMIV